MTWEDGDLREATRERGEAVAIDAVWRGVGGAGGGGNGGERSGGGRGRAKRWRGRKGGVDFGEESGKEGGWTGWRRGGWEGRRGRAWLDGWRWSYRAWITQGVTAVAGGAEAWFAEMVGVMAELAGGVVRTDERGPIEVRADAGVAGVVAEAAHAEVRWRTVGGEVGKDVGNGMVVAEAGARKREAVAVVGLSLTVCLPR